MQWEGSFLVWKTGKFFMQKYSDFCVEKVRAIANLPSNIYQALHLIYFKILTFVLTNICCSDMGLNDL